MYFSVGFLIVNKNVELFDMHFYTAVLIIFI